MLEEATLRTGENKSFHPHGFRAPTLHDRVVADSCAHKRFMILSRSRICFAAGLCICSKVFRLRTWEAWFSCYACQAPLGRCQVRFGRRVSART